MTTPFRVIADALNEAPYDLHESILLDLLEETDDTALKLRTLEKLVILLSRRLASVEAQAQGCVNALAHHHLDQ